MNTENQDGRSLPGAEAKARFRMRWAPAALVLALVLASLLAYWPSFFHVFRHDDWHVFFITKETPRGLAYLLKYTDLSLYQTHDRLLFRPMHFGAALALDRVLFDANYTARHLFTFLKHLATVLAFWLVLRQARPSGFAWVFALLFSVAVGGANVVMWPHAGGYLLMLAAELLAVFFFREVLLGRRPPARGFALAAVMTLAAMLAAEPAFFLPFALFGVYWVEGRAALREDAAGGRAADRASGLLLAPLLLWLVSFGIHLYRAYPGWQMTRQSEMVPLWRVAWNTARFVALLAAMLLAPHRTAYLSADGMSAMLVPDLALMAGLPAVLLALGVCARLGGGGWPGVRRALLPSLLLLSMAVIFCLARARHVNSQLDAGGLTSHYLYSTTALLLWWLYETLELGRVRQRKALAVALLLLAALHIGRVHVTGRLLAAKDAPLKGYFDAVARFVQAHRGEPGFSFKLIDRPPRPHTYGWYHETCVEGLFSRFIDLEHPAYVMAYDYELERLVPEPAPALLGTGRAEAPAAPREWPAAAHTNALGMRFSRVRGRDGSYLLGMFEVTQKEWAAVMGSNPSMFPDPDRPVENVSFGMVQEFIARLNRMESGAHYRLPTVSEWAGALLGARHRHAFLEEFCWYAMNAGRRTHPVGVKPAMPAGFHDLFGNVWEWCQDYIGYDVSVPPKPDVPRFCLGGSWRDRENRVARVERTHYAPDFRYGHLGFRLLRDDPQPVPARRGPGRAGQVGAAVRLEKDGL